MFISYINLFNLCIKWGYSREETACLPANDATRVDGFLLLALLDLRPLPINALLFDGDHHALAAARPTIAAHSDQLTPPPHGVSLEDAQQAPLLSPNPFHGNRVGVAIADTAMASDHSGDRYLHYGEESNATGNETAITAQNRFYQVSVFYPFINSLCHIPNDCLLNNL